MPRLFCSWFVSFSICSWSFLLTQDVRCLVLLWLCLCCFLGVNLQFTTKTVGKWCKIYRELCKYIVFVVYYLAAAVAKVSMPGKESCRAFVHNSCLWALLGELQMVSVIGVPIFITASTYFYTYACLYYNCKCLLLYLAVPIFTPTRAYAYVCIAALFNNIWCSFLHLGVQFFHNQKWLWYKICKIVDCK